MKKHDIIDTVESGKKIKDICKEKNVKAIEIVEELGIAEATYVYRWYKGKSFPSLYMLFKLSRFLETPIDDFIVVNKVKTLEKDEER
ncbi:MAG: helix-turn-helix transcriptional regulator [Lachnospiraceae bacterium]|nr:helix-turn-helix transcriptional regulator [Lachnospiraceae bacterium]